MKMWSDIKNSAMMGLQANANKRKLEMGACEAGELPAKAGRWSDEDAIAKLEAVAVPGEAWGLREGWSTSVGPGGSVLATTLLAAEDYDDEDEDFDDEYEEDESAVAQYLPLRGENYPCPRPCSPRPSYYGGEYQQQYCSRTPGQYSRAASYGWNQNGYYTPQEAASPQQTIRCAENGKSYLELGSASYGAAKGPKRCCDGRTNWCNSIQCYKERRLKMMNLSMCKLARFRQCADPSLHRSVLICNTLRCIEKEMENENQGPPGPPCSTYPQPMHQFHSTHTAEPQSFPDSSQYSPPVGCTGRSTPFPAAQAPDTDSGYGGDDDSTRTINWGSVLSLSSQSALDPINNNDLFSGSNLSAPSAWGDYGLFDVDLGSDLTELLPGWKLTPPSANEVLKSIDSDIECPPAHILVSS